MLKKQIILFVSLFMLLFSSTAAAANWQWINSNENFGLFFDTESIKFAPIAKGGIDKNIIYVWSRYVYDDAYAFKYPYNGKPSKASVQYRKLNINEGTITTLEEIWYDFDGNVLGIEGKAKTARVIPGTCGDVIYSAVKEYARIHAEEIADRSIR